MSIKTFLGSLFKRQTKLFRDELPGFWEIGADDGSGLHTMVWGYGLEFMEDGKGIAHEWGSGIPENERKQIFRWKRMEEKIIAVRFENEGEWLNIDYEISLFTGAYGSRHFRLVEKGKNTFWFSHEPLYKKR